MSACRIAHGSSLSWLRLGPRGSTTPCQGQYSVTKDAAAGVSGERFCAGGRSRTIPNRAPVSPVECVICLRRNAQQTRCAPSPHLGSGLGEGVTGGSDRSDPPHPFLDVAKNEQPGGLFAGGYDFESF